MRDGSDAIADWPILNALVNVAAGATWVSVHHGGGVGIGNSIHAGMVVVADGTDEMAARLERVLTTDPGMGVVRHLDAGYPEAIAAAAEHGLASRCRRRTRRAPVADAAPRPRPRASSRRRARRTRCAAARRRPRRGRRDRGRVRALRRRHDRGGRAHARPAGARRRRRGARRARTLRGPGSRRLPHAPGLRRRPGRGVLAPGRRARPTRSCTRPAAGSSRPSRDAGARRARRSHARGRRGTPSWMLAPRHDDVGGQVGLRPRPRHRARIAPRGRGAQAASPTWLGAHAVPPEHADADAYLDFALAEVLPDARASSPRPPTSSSSAARSTPRRRAATSRPAARRVSRCACTATSSPSAAPSRSRSSSARARSTISRRPARTGSRALAASDVVAVLLPASALFLGRPMPPARALVDAGAAVALATDFNPGSAFTTSLPLVCSLAATQLQLSPAEALARRAPSTPPTCSAARTTVGRLAAGYRADLVLLDAPDWRYLAYHLARRHRRRAWSSAAASRSPYRRTIIYPAADGHSQAAPPAREELPARIRVRRPRRGRQREPGRAGRARARARRSKRSRRRERREAAAKAKRTRPVREVPAPTWQRALKRGGMMGGADVRARSSSCCKSGSQNSSRSSGPDLRGPLRPADVLGRPPRVPDVPAAQRPAAGNRAPEPTSRSV